MYCVGQFKLSVLFGGVDMTRQGNSAKGESVIYEMLTLNTMLNSSELCVSIYVL